MRVSIVICTLNRADSLAATLECLRHQNHHDIEVIVVNGPSTDHTLAVLEPWRKDIQYFDNPERNLSISRNIGLRACSGELVAFIDDDALPEPEWLNQAIPAFDDPEVASAGGIVFDHTGMGLQYNYTATDRLLRATHSNREFVDQCFPGTFQFPYLQGTNQIHRRDRLMAVGGFDENIFFYGDDCDVCARMIDAGFVVRQLSTSPVHHKYLPSGIRDHQRITTNWFPVVHDHTYFCLRHASGDFTEDEILHSVHDFIHTRVADTQMHQDAGRLPAGSSIYAEATCLRAFSAGLQVGLDGIGVTLAPQERNSEAHFLPFATLRNTQRRRLVLVSNSYTGNINGGIGRLFSDLAPALAARGHDVRVITRATGAPAVDFEDGVWVHRIAVPSLAHGDGVVSDALAPINAFATAASKEVQRISTWTQPDLVFAPLWDVEAIGILRETELPVAVHVSTPLAIIGPMAGYLRGDDSDPPELVRLLGLEREVLATADLFQANTDAVTTTIRVNYDDECGEDRWRVVNIGLKDRAGEPAVSDDPGRRVVFFAGRFEARKGIDTLLDAMERILPDHPDVALVLAGEDRPLEPGGHPIGASWARRHRFKPWMSQVDNLGAIDDDELHRRYASAAIVVLPSRYESFGLVMVEAMMHGKPLVTTNTSGVREVVRHGIDGVLVEPGNVDELEAAIRRLLDESEYAAILAKSGRERFDAHLSIDRVAERFEQFLSRLRRVDPEGRDEPGRTYVAADGSLSIDLRAASAATVIVRADAPTQLFVLEGGVRTVELANTLPRRIRLDVSSGVATLMGGDAGITVEPLIVIEASPSA